MGASSVSWLVKRKNEAGMSALEQLVSDIKTNHAKKGDCTKRVIGVTEITQHCQIRPSKSFFVH